jgi:archaellum component FlaC
VHALEQRKEQIRQWPRMYDALQTEFAEVQEAANTQSAFVAEQNETIKRLTEMIDHLREMSRQQSTTNVPVASELRHEILQQKQKLVDTLNRISQAGIPAEQAFEGLNNKRQLEQEGHEDPGPPGAVRRPECERGDIGSGS